MSQFPDPYAPPAAPLEDRGAAASTVRPRFPFGLVLRWLLAFFYIVGSLIALFDLAMRWSDLADRSVIDRAFNPVWQLIPQLAGLTAGVLLALRRKWAGVAVAAQLIWQIALGYVFFGPRIPPAILGWWALEGLALWFCFNQWIKGRLR